MMLYNLWVIYFNISDHYHIETASLPIRDRNITIVMKGACFFLNNDSINIHYKVYLHDYQNYEPFHWMYQMTFKCLFLLVFMELVSVNKLSFH